MATAAETSIVVHRDGYTQWQIGKPTSLAVRRELVEFLQLYGRREDRELRKRVLPRFSAVHLDNGGARSLA